MRKDSENRQRYWYKFFLGMVRGALTHMITSFRLQSS